jgi:hypothetical protein
MKNSVIGKRVVLVLILFTLCTFQAAAQEDSFGLDEKVGMVLQMLSSPLSRNVSASSRQGGRSRGCSRNSSPG